MSEIEHNKVMATDSALPPDEADRTAAVGVPGEAQSELATQASGNRLVLLKRWLAARVGADAGDELVGNKLRPVRGGITALLGGLVAFMLMAVEGQYRWGVPIGILAMCVATFGVLDFMGTFDDPDDRVANRVTIAEIARPLAAMLGSLVATLVFIGLAVAGRLPLVATAVLVTGSFVALVVSTFRTGVVLGPWAVDETGEARPLFRRHGFWVVLTGTG